eukprot:TRINITY_DN1611_c0_g1_i4.p2 TRINITY_DN1611_c0_g1~~TRINITY_DN1611_c0_g1_i4.p2  ORF type:complete len:149 (-),score=32.54 TRINITY_DN1611_c0_g1_i4:157-603(-)
MLSHVRKSCPSAHVIVICPPPVCHEQRLAFQKVKYPDSPSGILERTNENTGLYAAAAQAVAKEFQAAGGSVACVNLWSQMQQQAPDNQWHSFLSDGLHLSEAGNEFVAKAVLESIRIECPALAVDADTKRPADLPHDAPWHDQFVVQQ